MFDGIFIIQVCCFATSIGASVYKIALVATCIDIFQPDLHGHKNGAESPVIRDVSLPLLSRTIMYLLKRVKETGLENDLNIIITR